MILIVKVVEGRKHTCSARCYHGREGAECHCVCGGMNHGKGEAQAHANTQAAAGRLQAEGCAVRFNFRLPLAEET